MKTNAAAYIRVSTDDQTEYSPDAQRKALEQYAKNNNMTLLSGNIFIDEGISGRKAEKRPAFMRMIACAKSKEKPFDVILVHKFDRFARNREDSVVYKSLLRKECGIKVISITESIEDDKFSIILESMLEAMAEYYSLNLADEVKKGMTEKAHRGQLQTKACFGYIVSNRTLEVYPEEAQYIEYIYNSYAAGNSIKHITYQLNTWGVTTKTGITFADDAVRYILRNPTYKGYAHWTPDEKARVDNITENTIIVQADWQPIISEELWNSVNEKLNKQKLLHKKKSRPSSEYVGSLSALIKCDNCGASLVYCNKRKYLQCNNYSHARCDISHNISVAKAEKAITEELNRLSTATDISDYAINIKKIDRKDDTRLLVEKQINNLKRKISRLKTAYLNEIISIDEYKNDKLSLENEISELEKQIKADDAPICTSDFIKKVKNVKAIFEGNYPDEEKNKALKSIIEKIVFIKANKTLVFYYYF